QLVGGLLSIDLTVSGSLDNLVVTAVGHGLASLLTPLVNALVQGLGSTLKGLILGTEGLVRELPSIVTGLTGPILETVSNINNQLFLGGVVQVLVNAQIAPQTGTNSVPPDLLMLETSQPGRFDVAAIRVGVL